MPKINIANAIVEHYNDEEVLAYIQDNLSRLRQVLEDATLSADFKVGAAYQGVHITNETLRALRKKKYGDTTNISL